MLIISRRAQINLFIVASIGLVALVFGLLAIKKIPFLYAKVEKYAHTQMEESYGSQPLSTEHETFIKEIAKEMGVDTPIIMRKFSAQGMQLYGYHNAIAAFHLFFNSIPLIDTQFLFISEGFFEDLSFEEQRFLIGHELVHIKEKHLRYVPFLENLLFLALLLLCWLYLKKIVLFLTQKYVYVPYQSFAQAALIPTMLFSCSILPHMISFAYRRHIEWEADRISVDTLGTHQGGIKLIERWVAKHGQPADNPLGDLFSDHPSNAQRRNYFLAQQLTLSQTSESKTV